MLGSRDVGHAFPTYVTPRVFLDVYQVDAAGIEISDTRVSGVIGREVDLAAGVEISDTRVLPGQTVRLDYDEPRAPGAAALSGRVTVDPDYHYRRVFASLEAAFTTPQARAHMAEALLGVADSAYVLVELRRELALR